MIHKADNDTRQQHEHNWHIGDQLAYLYYGVSKEKQW